MLALVVKLHIVWLAVFINGTIVATIWILVLIEHAETEDTTITLAFTHTGRFQYSVGYSTATRANSRP